MALAALQNTSVFYRRILSQFPQDISLAFAYGSGVFKQAGASQGQMRNNMLDFVFAVDDPITWHTMNLIDNRRHYSFLKYLGPRHISNIQNDYGARVYYNTLVPSEERVTDQVRRHQHGCPDGRLASLENDVYSRQTAQTCADSGAEGEHEAASCSGSQSEECSNRLLPHASREFLRGRAFPQHRWTLVLRMVIGEDKSKVSNIVKDNMEHFRILYNNILQECPQVVYKPQQGKLEVDKSPDGQFTQLMALPRTLQQQITRLVDPPGKNRDVEEILLQLAHDPDCGLLVQQGISTIVKTSSITQSAKGVATAGLVKTVSYSVKKLRKMLKGWRRKPQ
ncbi:phosphatidate cytidylyltransferase, mitochondrial isoform X2 [Hemibagrus wyckioides]|uniref:phosphatidate cytidylyltransferase, mitochondrial isoform X2 n=1 Tax=Hemibagrus wyckioides TaxID=337641 RepID=UPI00266C08BF|nr:phosphatidate cytidylyltransferase, mitochondrial isoform X2 [Hemibagrus wyckioides]